MALVYVTINKIDNGYIIDVSYTIGGIVEFHKKPSTILKILKRVLESDES